MEEVKQIDFKPFFKEIESKADRIMEITLLSYFVFGLFLASFYDTWLVGFGVGMLSLLIYFSSKFLLGKYNIHHYAASLVLGIFMAQFIYQMHGLFEMHFTALIAIILLIAYQNWKVFLPATIFIVAHHAIFAYVQYLGFAENNPAYQEVYFTQLDYMDMETFLFHVGLVAAAVFIASAYAYYNREASKLLFEKIIDGREKELINHQNIDFAKEITNGNYDLDIAIRKDDSLGQALLDMRNSLKESAAREKQDRFMNKGLAELSNIIRDNSNDINQLTYDIIEYIIKYMGLNQGGFFLVNDDKDQVVLELRGSYAYGRRKALKKSLMPGEGLVGQAYLEKDIIFLTEVPEDFIKIKSGLGDANPRAVIIIPVKREEQIEGIIELASFKVLEQYEIDFLKKAAESIAVALNSAKTNQRTTLLYEQSQQQTEEMRAQEEEMRQNMEELQATQEEMSRKEADIIKNMAEMKSIINGIDATMAVIEFEPDGTIVTANSNFLSAVKYSLNQIAGKHHRMFVPEAIQGSEEYSVFWTNLSQGISKRDVFERKTAKGETIWLDAIYTPIPDGNGHIIKVVKFANDVTELYRGKQSE